MKTAWIERELVGVTLTVDPQGAAACYVIDSPRRAPQSFTCWTSAERAFNEEVFAILGGVPYATALN
jgi:hypothetical protein